MAGPPRALCQSVTVFPLAIQHFSAEYNALQMPPWLTKFCKRQGVRLIILIIISYH